MATSSIFADFSIHDAKKASRFVDALYQSKQQLSTMTGKPPQSPKVRELRTAKEIKTFLTGGENA